MISAEETHSVRHPILRKGQPIKDCIFDGDELDTTIHVGLYIDKKLTGIATLLDKKNEQFSETYQYQLRGMAILKTYQGLKLGDAIINYCEHLLTGKGVQLLWFNARKTAIGFYKKNDYKIKGSSFEVKNVGAHYVMYKLL